MSLKSADRVRESTTSTGTGNLTLLGTSPSYFRFVDGIGVGNQCYYCVVDAGTGDVEIGLGTLLDAVTLRRDQVLRSTNGNALVNFGSNTKDIFLDSPAVSQIVSPDALAFSLFWR